MSAAQLPLSFPAGSQPVSTSEDAADALSGAELNRRRLAVLRLIASRPDGMTPDEVVAALGSGRSGDHNRYAPRCTELLQVGLLDRLDGKDGRPKVRRPTRAGGTGFVHVCSERGRAYLEDRHTLEQRSPSVEAAE